MRVTRTQLPWYKTLRVGDVLKSRSGKLRVVRNIYYFADGDLKAVSFIIKNCSWTGQPHTSYGFTDLRLHGYEPVGVRVRLNTDFDKAIEKSIKNNNPNPPITCCMVKGISQ